MYVMSRVVLGSAELSAAIGIIYVILPLVLSVVLGLLAKGAKDTRAATVLTLVIAVTVLVVVELRLELADKTWPNRSRAQYAARVGGQPFDGRTTLQVVDSLRHAGVRAFPALYGPAISTATLGKASLWLVSGADTVLPLSGPANRTTVYCNESGRYDIYRTDSGGFNNDETVWSDASPDIVVIGDSYVAGACVPRDSGMVSLLARRELRTMNLGVGGSGPLQELARLREFAASRKPRVVLWVYTEGNDFDDLGRELRNSTLRRYLTPGFTQRLASYGNRLSSAVEERLDSAVAGYDSRVSAWRRIAALSVRDVLLLQSLRDNLSVPSLATGKRREIRCCDFESYDYATFKHILASARDDVTAWGGRLVVAIIPDNSHFVTPSGRFCRDCVQSPYLDSLATARHRGIAIARELGIPIIDLHEPLFAQPRPESLFQFAGSHFSPAGYRTVANTLLRELERSGVTRSRPAATPAQ